MTYLNYKLIAFLCRHEEEKLIEKKRKKQEKEDKMKNIKERNKKCN